MDDVVKGKVEADASMPAQEPGRRSFFKKAFLTAAGMAFVGAAAETAEAQNRNGAVPLRAGDINVVFTEGQVSLQDLRMSLKQIVGMAGCTGCGMVGIDINFLRGEVISAGDAALLPAVQTILVTSE
jgi:hypothetical protein